MGVRAIWDLSSEDVRIGFVTSTGSPESALSWYSRHDSLYALQQRIRCGGSRLPSSSSRERTTSAATVGLSGYGPCAAVQVLILNEPARSGAEAVPGSKRSAPRPLRFGSSGDVRSGCGDDASHQGGYSPQIGGWQKRETEVSVACPTVESSAARPGPTWLR